MQEKNNTTVEYHVQDNEDIETSVLDAGEKHYLEGRYVEALNLFKNALQTNASSTLYLDIGNCYYKIEQYDQALNHWLKAVELDSRNSSAYSNLGNLYYKMKSIEKAVSYWIVALISTPEDGRTCLNLASAFDTKGMRFESIKYFERYIKYANDKMTMDYKKIQDRMQHCFNVANQYLEKGVELQRNGDYKVAAACYFKSLANYPNLSKTNQNLGSLFFLDNNFELAVKYWKCSTFIDAKYSRTFVNIATAYEQMEKFSYAYCYYHRYAKLIERSGSEHTKILNRMSMIKSKITDAEKHLRFANEYLSKNDFYYAIEEFTNYSILHPEKDAEYRALISKLESYIEPELKIIESCFKQGEQAFNQFDYELAQKYYRRAVKLSDPRMIEYPKAKAKIADCQKMIDKQKREQQ